MNNIFNSKIFKIIRLVFVVASPFLAVAIYKKYAIDLWVEFIIWADAALGGVAFIPIILGLLSPILTLILIYKLSQEIPERFMIILFAIGTGLGVFAVLRMTHWQISTSFDMLARLEEGGSALYYSSLALGTSLIMLMNTWIVLKSTEDSQIATAVRTFGILYTASFCIGILTVTTHYFWGDWDYYIVVFLPLILVVGIAFEKKIRKPKILNREGEMSGLDKASDTTTSIWDFLLPSKWGNTFGDLKESIVDLFSAGGIGKALARLFNMFFQKLWMLRYLIFCAVIFYTFYILISGNFMDAWLFNVYSGDFIGFEPKSYIALETNGIFHEPVFIDNLGGFLLLPFLNSMVAFNLIVMLEVPAEQVAWLIEHWND